MAVRAKFRYTGYMATHLTRPIRDERGENVKDSSGQYRHETVEVRTMTFAPVYGGTDPNGENKLFWDATPSGKLEMAVVNPEAWKQFEMGKSYYLTFEQAPE